MAEFGESYTVTACVHLFRGQISELDLREFKEKLAPYRAPVVGGDGSALARQPQQQDDRASSLRSALGAGQNGPNRCVSVDSGLNGLEVPKQARRGHTRSASTLPIT